MHSSKTLCQSPVYSAILLGWVGFAMVFAGFPACAWAGHVSDSLRGAKYYERTADGLVRFFYDRHYYLVDQDCHYKEIEREGHFDFVQRIFDGPIRDYGLDGELVMEGSYTNGKKEGVFRGYHPSGFVKWEVNYVDDIPADTIRYYYPDGRPYLEYLVLDGELLLWSYWNTNGKQRVKNGRGRFELVSEPSDAYNHIGYRWIVRRGRVRHGKMDMDIFYRYRFEDGTEYTAGYETYRQGRFQNGEDYEGGYFSQPRYALAPRIWHVRSEALVSKRCTVDDHIGFTHYAAETWQSRLRERAAMQTKEEGEVTLYLTDGLGDWQQTPYMLSDLRPRTLSFVLQVDKEGVVQSVESVSNFETPALAAHMMDAVKSFSYWVPSWDGDFIDDELTVHVQVHPGAGSPFFVLFDMHVIRKQGS